MASYSTAEALRLIMQEDTESEEDNVTENDASSEDGDYLLGLVTKRGKGIASGERGGRSRSCRGRDTRGTSDSAQQTAVDQSVVSINTIVDRKGRQNHLQSTDGKFRT
ncbi:hypothetical protein HELRODRAFT_169512 [Helobdella robusta]|uniref:Uncharacterized protein n=1 Tax=Helobdella robusta TaxID=6412 RepID=T1F213_HELRO|nr:hypothetical protein HELRODRAFT_169512 [Helobdella robusta]ESO08633.1 hypothetical protein HELRODRAFT_169512 [Helobdella robusta]